MRWGGKHAVCAASVGLLTARTLHRSAARSASSSGPGFISGREPDGTTAEPTRGPASAAPSTDAPTGLLLRDQCPPPVRSAAEAVDALAWAEAISAAGAQVSGRGFEDEALLCFRAAGMLLERAAEFDADR